MGTCTMVAIKALKKKPTKLSAKKRQTLRFTISCAPKVADEDIILLPSVETFLKDRIKINNKLNNLGKDVSVESTPKAVTVTANIPFSKRYLKYLMKKFLKKYSMKDFVRVVSKDKESYEFRPYTFDTDSESEDEA